MSKKNGIRPNPGQVQETFTVPGRTNYYMPIFQTFDAAAGTIHVAKRYRMIPRDRLETNLQAVINTLPAVAPAMTRYKARIYAFWVPDRLYVPELRLNFNGFGRGGATFDDEDTFVNAKYPVFVPVKGTQRYVSFPGSTGVWLNYDNPPFVASNSILNQAGFMPSNTTFKSVVDSYEDNRYSAMDILAYYDIFRNYFANANEDYYLCYQPALIVANSGAVDVLGHSALYKLPLQDLNDYYKYQLWINLGMAFDGTDVLGLERYFNCTDLNLDSAHFGAKLPFAPPSTAWNDENMIYQQVNPEDFLIEGAEYEYPYGSLNPYFSITPLAGLVTKTYMPDMFSAGISSTQYSNVIQNSLVAISNGVLNMNDLLAGERLYEYFTKMAATGVRYDEFIRAEFGVDIRKYLDIPTFIKSWSFDLGFAHVTATTGGNQALGTLAGRGVGKLDGDTRFNFSSDEYGSLYFLFTIEPYVSYNSSLDPFMIDTMYSDMFSPSFDRMGLEPMVDGLVYANPIGAGLDSTLFYQPVWTKYKTDVSRTFGEIANTLDYWVADREFSVTRANDYTEDAFTSYIKPFSAVPMFNVSDDYPCPFIVQMGFDTTIKRPISANSLDTF